MYPSWVQRQEAYLSRDSFFVISKTGYPIDQKILDDRGVFHNNKADLHHGFLPQSYYSND